MELVQMALDARPGAHSDGGRLALLAELLGVAERHSELQLRRARAALRDGDVLAAREHAAELAAQGYVPAWEAAAQAGSLARSQLGCKRQTDGAKPSVKAILRCPHCQSLAENSNKTTLQCHVARRGHIILPNSKIVFQTSLFITCMLLLSLGGLYSIVVHRLHCIVLAGYCGAGVSRQAG